MFPTLPTLLRAAMVFGVGLEFFFSGAREKPLLAVVRKSDRVQLPDRPGGRDVAYTFQSLDYPATERRFNCYFAEFFPLDPAKLRRHQHPGVEFIYTIQGRLALTVGEEEVALDAGDAIYFDATVPHAYRRATAKPCAAVVITA
jgi:mannose-6-phosphate isomerase-like protein (cupin superfamily)